MATKYIGCVEHSNGHITRLRIWSDNAWTTKARLDIVSDIEYAGAQYRTWINDPRTGKFAEGALVNVVTVAGTKYLRTTADAVARDNLGQLPDLAACPF